MRSNQVTYIHRVRAHVYSYLDTLYGYSFYTCKTQSLLFSWEYGGTIGGTIGHIYHIGMYNMFLV